MLDLNSRKVLVHDHGSTGTESKALGVHVQLGPVGGPLGKIPVVS